MQREAFTETMSWKPDKYFFTSKLVFFFKDQFSNGNEGPRRETKLTLAPSRLCYGILGKLLNLSVFIFIFKIRRPKGNS